MEDWLTQFLGSLGPSSAMASPLGGAPLLGGRPKCNWPADMPAPRALTPRLVPGQGNPYPGFPPPPQAPPPSPPPAEAPSLTPFVGPAVPYLGGPFGGGGAA